jgi:TPR repeat protein
VCFNGLGYLAVAGALSPTGERNFEEAAGYFEKSAAQNNAAGLYNLGLLLVNRKVSLTTPDGTPRVSGPTSGPIPGGAKIGATEARRRDVLRARAHFERAASMGSALSHFQLGVLASEASDVAPPNCPLALRYFRNVLRLGPWNRRFADSKRALVQGDYASALVHSLVMADLYLAKPALNAAFVLQRTFAGIPLPSVVETAMPQPDVAGSHDPHGEGNEDHAEFIHRLTFLAARLENVDAQLLLASQLFEGRGCAVNPGAGLEWLQRAARSGSVEAMHKLGWLHTTGMAMPEPAVSSKAPSDVAGALSSTATPSGSQGSGGAVRQRAIDGVDPTEFGALRVGAGGGGHAHRRLGSASGGSAGGGTADEEEDPRERDDPIARRVASAGSVAAAVRSAGDATSAASPKFTAAAPADAAKAPMVLQRDFLLARRYFDLVEAHSPYAARFAARLGHLRLTAYWAWAHFIEGEGSEGGSWWAGKAAAETASSMQDGKDASAVERGGDGAPSKQTDLESVAAARADDAETAEAAALSATGAQTRHDEPQRDETAMEKFRRLRSRVQDRVAFLRQRPQRMRMALVDAIAASAFVLLLVGMVVRHHAFA